MMGMNKDTMKEAYEIYDKRNSMKVLIWIHKDDIEKGVISKPWYASATGTYDYYQVSIDTDTFVRLMDDKREQRMNIIGQNGNDGIHYNIPEGADRGDEDMMDADQNDIPFGD